MWYTTKYLQSHSYGLFYTIADMVLYYQISNYYCVAVNCVVFVTGVHCDMLCEMCVYFNFPVWVKSSSPGSMVVVGMSSNMVLPLAGPYTRDPWVLKRASWPAPCSVPDVDPWPRPLALADTCEILHSSALLLDVNFCNIIGFLYI